MYYWFHTCIHCLYWKSVVGAFQLLFTFHLKPKIGFESVILSPADLVSRSLPDYLRPQVVSLQCHPRGGRPLPSPIPERCHLLPEIISATADSKGRFWGLETILNLPYLVKICDEAYIEDVFNLWMKIVSSLAKNAPSLHTGWPLGQFTVVLG